MAKTARELYAERKAADRQILLRKKVEGDCKCYMGMYKCPECKSEKTGTNTIATSERWTWFKCHDCGHIFHRSSDRTSSLSSSLRGLAEGAEKELSNE